MSSITLKTLSKHFGALRAVDNLELEVPHGSFTALLGPSGCGKTTTMNMISGLEQPTDGRGVLRRAARCRRCRSASATSASCSRTTRSSRTCRCTRTSRSGSSRSRAGSASAKAEIDARVKEVAETVGLSAALDRAGRPPLGERPPEGRARALDDHAPDDLPARRAVLEPRLGVPRVHARRAQAHPARGRPDDGVRHARSGRGDGHGRPDRGHGPRAAAAVRLARRPLRAAGEHVRRALHRLGAEQLHPRALRRRRAARRRRQRRRSAIAASVFERRDSAAGLTATIRPGAREGRRGGLATRPRSARR